eukprot:m.240098 g.240098  ORF g.240098 m.240098 type:complete len:407 (-) comp18986_c1_seq1:2260-3480(-)
MADDGWEEVADPGDAVVQANKRARPDSTEAADKRFRQDQRSTWSTTEQQRIVDQLQAQSQPSRARRGFGFADAADEAATAAANASQHYDRQADGPAKSFADARKERWKQRTYQLKRFHNDVKRELINTLSCKTAHHLDLACGRGSDIIKWMDAGIEHAYGLDVSRKEVEEAGRRLEEQKKRRRRNLNYEFHSSPDLGIKPIPWEQKFNTVSCMFAAHYFFASDTSLRNFLLNVACALEHGGFFYGVLPSGKRILETLSRKEAYKSDLLHIRRKWPGHFDDFKAVGSGYTFAILETVTNSQVDAEDIGEGCEEYVVFFGVFTEAAAQHHLFPSMSFDWSLINRKQPCLEQQPADGKHHAFRYLAPHYDSKNPDSAELEKITRLNAAFVFKKDDSRERCTRKCALHQH